MRCINEVSASELKGKHILLRAGLDVSLEKGIVADSFRLHRAAKTILFLRECGARTIIISHLGRSAESFEPVARELNKITPVSYVPDILGTQARAAIDTMREGDVLLLENLRRDPRETENDEGFARELAVFGEIYVDDAFSNVHRAHASMVGVPKLLPSYAGILMCEEIRNLEPARNPPQSSLAIIGGSKFETKEPLIEAFLKTYDHVFVTGALMNDVYKAQGLNVGRSLISSGAPSQKVINHPRLIIPCDVLVEEANGHTKVKRPRDIESGDKIVDIGPDSFAVLAPIIARAKLVLWNGPSGLYEDGYISWTHALAEAIAESGAISIIGGNNTLAAIKSSGVAEEKFTFLSTGGGAMLEYLLKGALPAIEVLG